MDVISTIRSNRGAIRRRFGVRRIGVFGSYARGEEKGSSDIDVLVDLKEPTFEHFMGLVFFLEDLLGRPVDLVTVKALSPYIAPTVKKEVVWCE
jgi:predicted nucleotidyltransferase